MSVSRLASRPRPRTMNSRVSPTGRSASPPQDYYAKHPNAIPRRGPRADAGSLNDDHAAAAHEVACDLVASIVAYMQTHKITKTKTMAAVRTVQDVQSLAGVDFLVAPVSVLERLNEIPTVVGYNDGISGGASMQLDEVPPIFQRAEHLRTKVKNFTDGKKVRRLAAVPPIKVRVPLLTTRVVLLRFTDEEGGVHGGD